MRILSRTLATLALLAATTLAFAQPALACDPEQRECGNGPHPAFICEPEESECGTGPHRAFICEPEQPECGTGPHVARP